MSPLMRRGSYTALRQRLGRIPYAPKSNVAMQRRGFFHSCALRHKEENKLELSRFLLRYPARSISKRAGYIGLLTLPCGGSWLGNRHLGIPSRVGFLDAVMVLRHGDRRAQPSEAPSIAARALPRAIGEHSLFAHAPIQHNDTRNYSENSDFHLRLLPNSAGAYVPPLFLAESHFTGRTPQSASLTPAGAA